MWDGKKEVAENIVYGALEKLKTLAQDGKDELALFLEAVDALKPSVEAKSRRVGGATYQVPVEVRPERQQTLALRWLVMFARKRGERSMQERLFAELRDALNGTGGAFKKKIDTHKMAEANKAFAHFRW
jgi:small subunit ribosomal protein S7